MFGSNNVEMQSQKYKFKSRSLYFIISIIAMAGKNFSILILLSKFPLSTIN